MLNYSDDEQTVTCHADGLKKLCDDSTVSAGDCITLAPWDFSILYADKPTA
ncbi:MAG: Beta-galactosidase C-terminal domain [Lachnospiraceae bacterium]|nr:Beta-galactosidase C-terminal domain [Lachnospiraceae bacterium]